MPTTERLASAFLVTAIGAAALGIAAPSAAAAGARTYYVSASGNDSHSGTSPATAWRTLQHVSSQTLAGDTVLLQGGSSFAGPLSLGSQDDGVTVGSFGTGRATILGQASDGILDYNANAVTVRDLNLVGDVKAFAANSGINAYNSQPAGQRLTGLSISNVTVRGFKDGVAIGGANAGAGFAQVSINNVTADGNRDDGVITYGPPFNAASPSYANAAVAVVHTTADKNLGNPANTTTNTGNGIVLGSVDGGSITKSSASGNGLDCTAPQGPAGIWTYDSRNVRIAYNTAIRNRTGGPADGDGFDLDQNVSNSVLEHNVSRGNDGAGYLVYTAQNNTADHGNIVRWNSSTGDANKNAWYAGILLFGKVADVTVTGNTVDTSRSASHAPALAIKPGVTGAKISGNTLKSAARYSVIVSQRFSRAAAAITRNHWATSRTQRVHWGSALYRSVAAWTRATGEN